MKTVGKQLQEARLAKNWTPELAARETKIKVDRLGDLERDDYSHFTSPTYARGFVRTYARALGLDEYQILRQLDNKLPDDDSANIVTDTGVAYVPETAMPARVAHRDYTGLYIVMALGGVVTLVIAVVLFEAYRVGELTRYFGSKTPAVASASPETNADGTPANPTADAPARAMPVDSSTPPPIAEPVADPANGTNAAPEVTDGLATPRALPVDASAVNAAAGRDAPVQAARALPVNAADSPAQTPPATPTGGAADAVNAAPRALPVDSSASTNAATATPASTTLVAVNTPPPVNRREEDPPEASAPPAVAPSTAESGGPVRVPSNGPVMEPSMPAVEPAGAVSPGSEAVPKDAPPSIAAADADKNSDRRLVLTASHDSFVRVTDLDASQDGKPLYAAVLHSGQSVGFDGHKFSISVGVPSAVDITLDKVNYGPHSDRDDPETFTVQSHQP